MDFKKIHFYNTAQLNKPRVLLGFSGWMDGGEVSTGTIRFLIDRLEARKLAGIEGEGFYIYNFPGTMEFSSIFRPHVKMAGGMIESFEGAENVFYYSENHNLLLFIGKEPNLNWREFTDLFFSFCKEYGASELYFIGSVAGLVPHTREPRFNCVVSEAGLKEKFATYGVNFSDYEGPCSIVTYMTANAKKYDLHMGSLIAQVPAYVQGNNPKCIEGIIKRLAALLEMNVNLDSLREQSDEFEKRLGELIQQEPELEETIRKLEENYDNELFNNEMGDLKSWLEQKGVRLD